MSLVRKLILILALTGLVLGFLQYLQYRQQRQLLIQQKQNAKAEETQVTIIEGWTVQDIADYLEKNKVVAGKDFLVQEKTFDSSSYPLLNSKPKNMDLEGFLFPDTYRILKSLEMKPEAAKSIITKQLDNFSLKFTSEMQQQAQAQKMPIYQIVILASIIEKETGRNAVTGEQKAQLDIERKIISGIFYNRLKIGQPLESDATINYITKKSDPQVSSEDLTINSPYNTYKYKDLPPGPICNPSLSSILAALYPTATDYYYFLHKQPSGEPVYSKTYQEHLLNKEKYLR